MEQQYTELELNRYPKEKDKSLQAWDAADEYLADYIHNYSSGVPENDLLIINDAYGAITLALLDLSPAVISDSYLSQLAITKNLKTNGFLKTNVNLLSSTEEITRKFEFILIKIPKSLEQLRWMLLSARNHAGPKAKIIGGGMTRNIHNSTSDLFAEIVGDTKTSLARKKARLVFADFDPTLELKLQQDSTSFEFNDQDIRSHTSVFGATRIDQGSELLIKSLSHLSKPKHVADLGCGTGILGLAAMNLWSEAEMSFFDDSYIAIDSCLKNVERLFPARFVKAEVHDGLSSVDDESFDLILCNPPFHSGTTISASPSLRMFKQSKIALKTGGHLVVVGNQHLGYQSRLREVFSNAKVLIEDNKFVVLMAEKY